MTQVSKGSLTYGLQGLNTNLISQRFLFYFIFLYDTWAAISSAVYSLEYMYLLLHDIHIVSAHSTMGKTYFKVSVFSIYDTFGTCICPLRWQNGKSLMEEAKLWTGSCEYEVIPGC